MTPSTPMLRIGDLPSPVASRIASVFTDIDDTLTTAGRLPAVAYDALWRAHDAGLAVVPVTGRPAGWCDHLARMWPVTAVVGENGALAFAMRGGRMERLYAERPADAAERLAAVERQILAEVDGCKVSADQPYREYDLAIDFCEEVAPLGERDVDRIVAIFEEHGATAKVSSIHVNGWFGEFDKLTMCKRAAATWFGGELDPDCSIFVGDSPNDQPMFGFFPHAVGVANLREMAHRLSVLPRYITEREGGAGFAEVVDALVASHTKR